MRCASVSVSSSQTDQSQSCSGESEMFSFFSTTLNERSHDKEIEFVGLNPRLFLSNCCPSAVEQRSACRLCSSEAELLPVGLHKEDR